MTKLKLNPEPTFKATVGIPVPGVGNVDVEFTFKHRTRKAITDFLEAKQEDVLAVQDTLAGWDLDDEFSSENIERLLQNYPGAGFAIISNYLQELRGARTKN